MMENYSTPFSLEGKTILVTGASSGIGKSVALTCSEMGADVVITGRNEERLAETFAAMTGNKTMLVADLTDDSAVEALAESCPSLDGVVHCAGVLNRTMLKMVREKDIDKVMKINFTAPVLLQGALLRHKKINKSSSIVFMASRAPFAPSMGNGLYAASKGAIIAYAKVLGLELAMRKIRVNCVCPAMVWTDMTVRDSQAMNIDYTQVEKNYPLGRFGQPEDVANLVVYLLSDASGWMTGSCIDITGGGEFTLK